MLNLLVGQHRESTDQPMDGGMELDFEKGLGIARHGGLWFSS
jgi:hypothetical protein